MPRRPCIARAALLVLVLAPSACVKKSTHELTLANLARARSEQDDLRAQIAADAARRDREEANLRSEIESLQARLVETQAQLERTERLRAQAEERFTEARAEIDRLELIQTERGEEYRRLQQRIQTLGAIEREVRERNRIYEEVIGRFQSLIDGGQLTVAIVRGRMVIQLPQDILFQSGSATLAREGRETLAQVGRVLAELSDRTFQVEGHTDNVPISTERFPSNWELSTARALSVVRLLVEQGVPPTSLSGAGYGEFQPVASNEDRDGRRLNRRIEIVMLPNLDVIAAAQLPG
jgi:chemotaxis protein MotB